MSMSANDPVHSSNDPVNPSNDTATTSNDTLTASIDPQAIGGTLPEPDGALDPADPSLPRERELTRLFADIMAVRSVSGEEGALADRIERMLRTQPHLQVRRHGDTVVAVHDAGRDHGVVLAGHIDTVPVIRNFPPVILRPGDGRIDHGVAHEHPDEPVMWGRGSTDMKASDAVLLYLACTVLEPQFNLTYVFYDHEEVAAEHNGLRKVLQDHPDWIRGDFAIIGEPTSGAIEGGCNGTMRFDVVSHGVAAHSARAWMGRNAIHAAGEILDRLRAYTPQDVTVDGLTYREGVNATMISGGTGTNVIPDECRIHVNYRFAPDKTLAQAKALMMGEDAGAELGNGEHEATGGMFRGFGIEMRDESPAARPGLDAPLSRSLVELVRARTGADPHAKLGWTDVARFSALGIPAVNLGAGSALFAHKADEQIAMGDLPRMESLLRDWLTGRVGQVGQPGQGDSRA
ncbi:MAG: succinyl-diaminopimelate desuccinylase [Bifidobacterium mongoliense]|nr:succinyl-diaminopimelate desuccinylase [Bifidobacterium mongoliense]MDY3125501.1 succinyl-diaminopimelate desuccinylase [Bifidobacterium mongoliense]